MNERLSLARTWICQEGDVDGQTFSMLGNRWDPRLSAFVVSVKFTPSRPVFALTAGMIVQRHMHADESSKGDRQPCTVPVRMSSRKVFQILMLLPLIIRSHTAFLPSFLRSRRRDLDRFADLAAFLKLPWKLTLLSTASPSARRNLVG